MPTKKSMPTVIMLVIVYNLSQLALYSLTKQPKIISIKRARNIGILK